jgi:hypothetical protein
MSLRHFFSFCGSKSGQNISFYITFIKFFFLPAEKKGSSPLCLEIGTPTLCQACSEAAPPLFRPMVQVNTFCEFGKFCTSLLLCFCQRVLCCHCKHVSSRSLLWPSSRTGKSSTLGHSLVHGSRAQNPLQLSGALSLNLLPLRIEPEPSVAPAVKGGGAASATVVVAL